MQPLPDFETLLQLAKEDPPALNQLKQQHTQALISNAAPEHRANLTALQHSIDVTVERASNPYHGLMQVMSMMQNKLAVFSQALNSPDSYLEKNAEVIELVPKSASVSNEQ